MVWLHNTVPNTYFQCRGSGMFMQNPGSEFFFPGSQMQGQKDSDHGSGSALTKKLFLGFWKYDPGCSSRIRILIFYLSRIPDPGVKKAPDPGSATLYILPTSRGGGGGALPIKLKRWEDKTACSCGPHTW
jgi:hypothetical protein